ncbi:HpcH/HpaI aldolase/citrate lyase family protein [Sinomicrobium soli]|uniref:HpcH/HpaI aldolase/citrate lyase family protein n=1 Tax=Sinomicrobium sp. N-1-3-6 TaxID=2219864 RepID=UPI000DCB5B88|nr:aldolase/citrate lyase family protein [Sinomicrobium sp. N-1-3-6]RAV30985.1 hypothetical protein DN748_01700 [Sinomicrobium sp. N-1-3-6]
MESFFFIPANRLHKISEIEKIGVTEIIIDLEDSIKRSEIDNLIEAIIKNTEYKKYFIRVPVISSDLEMEVGYIKKLSCAGFSKFLLPKIRNKSDLRNILEVLTKSQLILLVENPQFFLEAKELMLEFKEYLYGLALGSHDFMAEMGGSHTMENIEIPRQYMLYLARAFGIKAIDIASMELTSEGEFQKEVLDGFRKGYEAKFFIHPWQIEILREIKFYTEGEYEWALKVKQKLDEVEVKEEFNAISLEGRVLEKPHIDRALRILKYYRP